MPVPMVVGVMMLVTMGVSAPVVVELVMFVRVAVTMVLGTMKMAVPAFRQQRPDAPPEHRDPQTHHHHPRHRTQLRVELLGKNI